MYNQSETVLEWLHKNPPDGTNRAERRKYMEHIQKICDELTAETYKEYRGIWSDDPQKADALESKHEALWYFKHAIKATIKDIQETKVEQGIALWLIYNMGYVFKTPTSCFAIDLNGRHVEELADMLDFLLTSHVHADHQSAPLREALLAQGKPIISNYFKGGQLIDSPTRLTLGDVTINIQIGDHHYRDPEHWNNMLMFEIDCGTASGNVVVYHCGDNSNYQKMNPDKVPDVFMYHISVGMNSESAINHLAPGISLASHLLELGHSPVPPKAWRWPFEYAFRALKNIPENKCAVLTWGEKLTIKSKK